MSRAAYPTAVDLTDFLTTVNGITVDILAGMDLDDMASQGQTQFEGAISRRLLAVTQSRTFTPPSQPRMPLFFRADLVSLTSLTIQGQTKTVGVDFELGPDNADLDGNPWQWARPLTMLWPLNRFLGRVVTVTGSWGYGATIPEDAWQAILRQGALNAWPQIHRALTSGMQRMKEGDVDYTFTDIEKQVQGWSEAITRAETRYKAWRPN